MPASNETLDLCWQDAAKGVTPLCDDGKEADANPNW